MNRFSFFILSLSLDTNSLWKLRVHFFFNFNFLKCLPEIVYWFYFELWWTPYQSGCNTCSMVWARKWDGEAERIDLIGFCRIIRCSHGAISLSLSLQIGFFISQTNFRWFLLQVNDFKRFIFWCFGYHNINLMNISGCTFYLPKRQRKKKQISQSHLLVGFQKVS